MHSEAVGTGRGEGLKVAPGILDHEVDVEGEGRAPAAGLHHQRPESDIGDETPIHHIYMEEIGTGLLSLSDLLSQARKVRSEDRGGDRNGHDSKCSLRMAGRSALGRLSKHPELDTAPSAALSGSVEVAKPLDDS